MKYVITGSTGHISRPIIQNMVAAGHDVKVITSNKARSQEIESLGATPLVGSVEDATFLKNAFDGADAAYTMVPPHYETTNLKGYIASIGKNFASALEGGSVKYVVNLSSVGAHLPDGCGPVNGLYGVEHALNGLTGVNVLHLRPGYFYSNFLANIGMIKNMGIIGANFGSGPIVMSHTKDVAEFASRSLLNLDFSGKSIAYLSSDAKTPDEVASSIGNAIGKPDLKWVDFTDEQSLGGLMQAGLPEEIAKNYTEMGGAMRNQTMFSDYISKNQKPNGKISFKEFSNEFAAVYNQ